MDMPLDAEVVCSDGVAGRSTYVIVNPQTEELTHVVVKELSGHHTERLVAVPTVETTTKDHIILRCSRAELSAMEPFMASSFVQSPIAVPQYTGSPDMVRQRPYVYQDVIREIRYRAIPPGELSVRRGEKVAAIDGVVGTVDEFLINRDGHITHLVLREGHLWGKKDVTIPVDHIDRLAEGSVYIKLTKEEVGGLPHIPIRRS
jgi:hypothetical protein